MSIVVVTSFPHSPHYSAGGDNEHSRKLLPGQRELEIYGSSKDKMRIKIVNVKRIIYKTYLYRYIQEGLLHQWCK